MIVNMRFLCRFLAAAVFSLSFLPAYGASGEFVYFFPGEKRASIVIDLGRSEISVGHRGMVATFTIDAKADSMESAALTFSISKELGLQDRWQFKSVDHRRIGEEIIVLGGRKVAVDRIDISNEKIKTVLYSRRLGVVAFEVFDGQKNQRIYLKGHCGLFGWRCD